MSKGQEQVRLRPDRTLLADAEHGSAHVYVAPCGTMMPVKRAGALDDGHASPWDVLWMRALPGIHRQWLAGLGFNPAAPDAVLIRLLEHQDDVLDYLWRSDLPQTVIEAAVDHPNWHVRGHLLEDHQFRALTARHWARLLEGPAAEVRRRGLIVSLCAESGTQLGADLIDRLTQDPNPAVRAAAAALPGVPAARLVALAGDPAPKVRAAAAPHAWAVLDATARQLLLDDVESEVRDAARLHRFQHELTPPSALAELPKFASFIARNCVLTDETFRLLADGDAGPACRLDLASNPHLTSSQVSELATNTDPWVRLRVSVRPELTDAQRTAIPLEVTSQTTSSTLSWVAALHDDAKAMRRLAQSAHPFIRRSVARAPHLAADVVARLARDPDRIVQLFLAESCLDATPDILLSVAAWWNGSLSQPGRPHSHPNFPREGLLRFASDPNPLLRRLALDDPASTAALAEELVNDSDELVRDRAIMDPRLSKATFGRLLEHRNTRGALARNTGLPDADLIDLLCTQHCAKAAATNPRIPATVMHRMIDHAEVVETAL